MNRLRPLHDTGAKGKKAKVLLIEAGKAANSWLLASFLTKSSEILDIFTRDCIVQRSQIAYSIHYASDLTTTAYNRVILKTDLKRAIKQGQMEADGVTH